MKFSSVERFRATLMVVCLCTQVALAVPYYRQDLGPIPANGSNAVATINTRANIVILANACGSELEFFQTADEKTEDGKHYKGGIYPGLISKVAFLGRSRDLLFSPSCVADVAYPERNSADTWGQPFTPERWAEPLSASREQDILKSINKVFRARYGAACENVVRKIVIPQEPDKPRLLHFEISHDCLRAEIRTELSKRDRIGNPGSSGLPCYGVGPSPEGDWDMAVYQLTRLAYLSRAAGVTLDSKKLDQLLTISGALEGESYGLMECGNPDNTYGSAQERADESDFYDDGFFQDFGGILKWLLIFLAVLAILVAPYLLTALGAANPGTYAAAGAALLAAAGGSLAINLVRIEETENHLLMINSSKYLKNQLIVEELNDHEDQERFRGYNEDIKEWLLDRFQELLKEDFVEYNSRPYGRLSVGAILNIHDFANDRALKNSSGAVLDYLAAKMALSSSQGRRIVPFRRVAGTNAVFTYGSNLAQPNAQQLFFLGGDSDHMLAAMMLWSGQTQHSEDHRASLGALGEMVPEATSTYRPHALILDIAIDKSVPYEQRIHHDGWEIYSSGKGWLLSAGGTSTDFAQLALIAPLGVQFEPPLVAAMAGLKDENRGAGVPTVLLPHSASIQQNRYGDFLRFEGQVKIWNKDKPIDDQPMSYDDNLCVRRGFACGLRLSVPPAIETCLQRPPGTPPNLFFIDSAVCPPYQDADRFFVIMYRLQCSLGFEKCKGGYWGFIEVVDVDSSQSLSSFAQLTVQRNGSRFAAMPATETGTGIGSSSYVSARGETLLFDPDAHDDDDDEYGILQIDGGPDPEGDLDDWQLASGDIIVADGEGRVTITRPGDSRVIRLDLSDAEAPKRELPP